MGVVAAAEYPYTRFDEIAEKFISTRFEGTSSIRAKDRSRARNVARGRSRARGWNVGL